MNEKEKEEAEEEEEEEKEEEEPSPGSEEGSAQLCCTDSSSGPASPQGAPTCGGWGPDECGS